MTRRTKYEMAQMNNDCRLYLLQTKLDYIKAFEMMVKDSLESGRQLPYYIKGITDFKKVAQELAVELNQEELMKKSDKEIYQVKQESKNYILDMTVKEAMQLYKDNKDSVSESEKLNLVDLVTLKNTGEFNEKYISDSLIRLINKLNNCNVKKDVEIQSTTEIEEYSAQKFIDVSSQEESSSSIQKGTLLSNKKGEMFTIQEVKNYTYKEKESQKFIYYPVSDNGLINKTKAYTCNIDDVQKYFTVLDWKF